MEIYNETVVGKGGSKVAAAEKGAFFAERYFVYFS